jgi:hypothetical protein
MGMMLNVMLSMCERVSEVVSQRWSSVSVDRSRSSHPTTLMASHRHGSDSGYVDSDGVNTVMRHDCHSLLQ